MSRSVKLAQARKYRNQPHILIKAKQYMVEYRMRNKAKTCLQCPNPVTSKSHRVQHCSEECTHIWQIAHLGRELADRRAYQRAVAKRQREHDRADYKLATSRELGYCPMTIQYTAPEKIDRNWDRFILALATAPKVAPHKRIR